MLDIQGCERGPELKNDARGGKLRAMASAQVYFNRPHEYAPFKRMVWGRGDGKF